MLYSQIKILIINLLLKYSISKNNKYKCIYIIKFTYEFNN